LQLFIDSFWYLQKESQLSYQHPDSTRPQEGPFLQLLYQTRQDFHEDPNSGVVCIIKAL